ncbi:MAG: hypothetical protein QOE55_3523, partial [Acidobacteriaceae bacterium]|nr:hypothetical protein [Acidobacteriaceae bacterium]
KLPVEKFPTSLPRAVGEIRPFSTPTQALRAESLPGRLNLIWNRFCAQPGNGRHKVCRVSLHLLGAARFSELR